MPKFILVFGRNELLSLLEAESLFKSQKIKNKIIDFSKKSVLIEASEWFNAQKIIKDLGSIVKIAMVLAEANIEKSFKEFEKELEKNDFTQEFGKKFYYSIGNYGKNESKELKEFLQDYFKQKFKKQKLKAMLKWPKEIQGERKKSISPKLLAKRISKHLDLCFFENNERVFFGKTIAVCNPEEFKKRDLERPVQKPEIETSVRLARILVNLASLEKGKTILDPFCGIGTIMQEAMLSGYNVIGNDSSIENANACRKNLEWLKKKHNCSQNFKVFNNDSKKLSQFLKAKSFQAVVSEPYLGPLLRKLPSLSTAQKTINELSELYFQTFKELSKLMQTGEKIVIVMPQIPTIEGKKLKISENTFLNNGFKVYNLLEKEIPNLLPYLYRDKENRLERLIFVLKKNKARK